LDRLLADSKQIGRFCPELTFLVRELHDPQSIHGNPHEIDKLPALSGEELKVIHGGHLQKATEPRTNCGDCNRYSIVIDKKKPRNFNKNAILSVNFQGKLLKLGGFNVSRCASDAHNCAPRLLKRDNFTKQYLSTCSSIYAR